MRAAMTTSNLAATQLFKTNRKQRTEEDLPSFVNTGRTVVGGRRNSSVMSNFAMHGMDAQHLLAQARLHRLPSNDPNQLPASQRLRAAKLKDLSKDEICLESMRKLFRLLDEDGGGTVDPSELKKGMELLGFEDILDPVALDRLVREIDEDKTGTIEENEFLAYFSRETRASLKTKLKNWCLNYTHIKATRYHSQGPPDVEVAEIQAGSVGGWLQEVVSDGDAGVYNYWLEVTGYDRPTFTSMAKALGFEHDDFASLLVCQNPECCMVEGKQGVGAQFIIPSAKLSLNPVPTRTGAQLSNYIPDPVQPVLRVILGNHDRGIPNYLAARQLAKRSEIANITISIEQAAVFVASKNVLITFRNPIGNYESFQLSEASALSILTMPITWSRFGNNKDKLKKSSTVSMIEKAWTAGPLGSKAGNAVPEVSPFAKENSAVRLQFEWLRNKLAMQCPSTSLAANVDVKMLAVLIIDQLLTSNYVIRDRVQDWEELVEASIRGVQSSASVHLEAMGVLLDRFIDHLDPLAKMLSPDSWDVKDEEGNEDDSGQEAANELLSTGKKRDTTEDDGEGDGEEDGKKKKVVQKRIRALGSKQPAIDVTPVTGVAGPDTSESPIPRKHRKTEAKEDGHSSPVRSNGQGQKSPTDRPAVKRRPSSETAPRTAADRSEFTSGRNFGGHSSEPPRRLLSPTTSPRLPAANASAPSHSHPLAPAQPAPLSPRSRDPSRPTLTPLPSLAVPLPPRQPLPEEPLHARAQGRGASGSASGSEAAANSAEAPPHRPAPPQTLRGAGGGGRPAPLSLDNAPPSRAATAEAGEKAKKEAKSENLMKEFFSRQLEDFQEIATDVNCLVEGSMARHDRVDNLARRLNNAKQDMINRTLYALTLVTAIATPVTICTGIYGMNFEDMPELDPRIPGNEDYGYKFFWKVIATVVSSMIFFLFRLGLFKTLL